MSLLLRFVINAFSIWIVSLIPVLTVTVTPFAPGGTLQLVLTLLLLLGGVAGAQFGAAMGGRLRGEETRALLGALVLALCVGVWWPRGMLRRIPPGRRLQLAVGSLAAVLVVSARLGRTTRTAASSSQPNRILTYTASVHRKKRTAFPCKDPKPHSTSTAA